MFRLSLGCLWIITLSAPVGANPKPREPEMVPYVEFDFRTLPQVGTGTYTVKLTIETQDKDVKFSESLEFARGTNPNTNCEFVAAFLNRNKFKSEVINKTKLRVYGRTFNDKLIPATKGMVESPDLKPEELPKVTNPEKKG
jgi:hypothetical protein